MPTQGETDIQRVATARFIDYDPTEIVLTRVAKEPNGAGGYLEADPTDLPPQRFRLIPQLVQGRVVETTLIDGTVVEATYHLLGEYGVDIQRGDTFMLNGVKYEVAWVTTPGDYETKAGAANRG